jgi:SAM-dependent methyltransferase
MPGPVSLRFDPEREEAELREYLGEDYDRRRLEHYEEDLDAEVAAIGDEATLYRTSRSYLYNLTVFAMSGTKLPYLDVLTSHVRPGSRVLDYGCGIGSDGLMLLEAGYRVEFADFDNPSTAYLRWRLERRSLEAPVHDLDGGVGGGFDAAYAFDVIEHVPDAFALLAELERRAALVEVNLLEFEPHEQTLHYELPIGRLLRHAAQRGLEEYRIFHGSSHLVLYRPERSGVPRRLLNLSRLVTGRRRRGPR